MTLWGILPSIQTVQVNLIKISHCTKRSLLFGICPRDTGAFEIIECFIIQCIEFREDRYHWNYDENISGDDDNVEG